MASRPSISRAQRALILAADCEHVMRLASDCLSSREDCLKKGDLDLVSSANVFAYAHEVLRSKGKNGLAAFRLGQLAIRLGYRGVAKDARTAIESQKRRAKGRQDTADETRAAIRKEFDDLKTPKTRGAVIAAAKLIHEKHPAAPGEKNGYARGTVLGVLRKYVREGATPALPAEKIPADS